MILPLSIFAQLTGYWQTDVGGCYQIRQDGNEVWWIGESAPNKRASIVFQGIVVGNILNGQWCDMPSHDRQNCGQGLSLRIENNDRMVKIGETISYSGSVWTRGGCSNCEFDLTGNWQSTHSALNRYNVGGYSISQNGNQLTLKYSGDGSQATATCENNTITYRGWDNGSGKISNGGRRIDFSNGSYWIKM